MVDIHVALKLLFVARAIHILPSQNKKMLAITMITTTIVVVMVTRSVVVVSVIMIVIVSTLIVIVTMIVINVIHI